MEQQGSKSAFVLPHQRKSILIVPTNQVFEIFPVGKHLYECIEVVKSLFVRQQLEFFYLPLLGGLL